MIQKVSKHKCLKFPYIVHLDLICMSYDQKKGQESNSELKNMNQMRFDLDVLYTNGKSFWKLYDVALKFLKTKLDLKKIWTVNVLGQLESQFWDSHLKVLGENDIWM
jgi:hypothetical protein